jgi:hypothetical protein
VAAVSWWCAFFFYGQNKCVRPLFR